MSIEQDRTFPRPETAVQFRRGEADKSLKRLNRTILCLSVLAAAYAAVALGQDTSWDVKNYHFYSGYAFLHKPLHYDFAPAQVQSFFNPLMHVLTFLLLYHLPPQVAAAIFGALQGLNFFLVFRISDTLLSGWKTSYRLPLSLGSAIAGFWGSINISEIGSSMGDNTVSLFVLTGLLLILRYMVQNRPDGLRSLMSVAIAGGSIGFAVGLKLTFTTYAIAIALGFAALHFRGTRRLSPVAALYAGLILGFLAAYGIWGASLFAQFDNPVFPYMNKLFRSAYYDLENTMDARFLPRNWQQTFFYPFFFVSKNSGLVSEVEFRDARIALCYISIVILALTALINAFLRVGRRIGRHLSETDRSLLTLMALFFTISYAVWQHLSSIYRYLIVLELLAPAFLTLVLAFFFKRRLRVLAFALALDASICAYVIPFDWGRQEFDESFLKVRIPPIPELDRCVVLMAGEEPTSYIVPFFPPGTRFVRVLSNFMYPGRNSNLDQLIRGILSRYDDDHTLVYVASASEMYDTRQAVAYYDVMMDRPSCVGLSSGNQMKGFLCRVVAGPVPASQKQAGQTEDAPAFEKDPSVRLTATPSEVTAGRDSITYRVTGLHAEAVDMLYTVDDEPSPPVRNWTLDARQSARVFVSPSTRKGAYHIIGIRRSGDEDANKWIEVDVLVRIK